MTNVALSATSQSLATGGGNATVMTASLIALRALWAQLPDQLITIDKLREVNAKMVPGPAIDVPRINVNQILDGASIAVKAYAATGSNLQARIACNYLLALIDYENFSPTIQTSDPEVQALVQRLAPDLLADPATGVTQDIIDQMLSFITPPIPWWQANGFPHAVDVLDLINAGNLY